MPQGGLKLFNQLVYKPTTGLLAADRAASIRLADPFWERVQRKAKNFEGFDPGSERTLAAWIRHASRTRTIGQLMGKVAKGAVRRG